MHFVNEVIIMANIGRGNLMMRGGPGSLRPPTLSTKDAYHVFVPCVGETCGRGGAEDEEES